MLRNEYDFYTHSLLLVTTGKCFHYKLTAVFFICSLSICLVIDKWSDCVRTVPRRVHVDRVEDKLDICLVQQLPYVQVCLIMKCH